MYRTVTQPTALEQVTRRINWYLPDWLLHFNHTLLFKFEGPLPEYSLPDGYELRMATSADITPLTRTGMHEEIARERFKHGDSCALILKGDEVVTFGWMTTGQFFLLLGGVPFCTVPKGRFMYDVVTAPIERGKGFMKACYAFHMNQYRASGTTTFHATIDIFNRASIVSHLKFGFKAAGASRSVTIFGVHFAWSTEWPGHSPSFNMYVRRPPEGIRAI